MSVTSQYRGRLQLARQDKIAQFIAGTLAAISMISFLALGTYLWALGWLQGTKLIDPFSTAASAPTVVVTPPTAPATAPSPEPTALTFESACAAAKRAYEQTDYPEAWQITAAALPLAKTPDQQRRLYWGQDHKTFRYRDRMVRFRRLAPTSFLILGI